MEWTTGLELPARLLELNALADNLDDVGTSDKIIDEILGNQSSHTEINGNSEVPGLPAP